MRAAASRTAWQGSLAVLALTFAWLAATAWMRPLMLPDEGRYATVAWEMLRSGDWLTPALDGMPFFHKPPLFYWITGAALSVAGLTEIAARAASLVGATLGAFSLYLFTQRWSGGAAARRVLVLLLVQPLFFAGGQFANLDMLVAGCITATVLALAHAALCFEQGLAYRRVLWLAYGLAALGVLATWCCAWSVAAPRRCCRCRGWCCSWPWLRPGSWPCSSASTGSCTISSWCSISSASRRAGSTMRSRSGSIPWWWRYSACLPSCRCAACSRAATSRLAGCMVRCAS